MHIIPLIPPHLTQLYPTSHLDLDKICWEKVTMYTPVSKHDDMDIFAAQAHTRHSKRLKMMQAGPCFCYGQRGHISQNFSEKPKTKGGQFTHKICIVEPKSKRSDLARIFPLKDWLVKMETSTFKQTDEPSKVDQSKKQMLVIEGCSSLKLWGANTENLNGLKKQQAHSWGSLSTNNFNLNKDHLKSMSLTLLRVFNRPGGTQEYKKLNLLLICWLVLLMIKKNRTTSSFAVCATALPYSPCVYGCVTLTWTHNSIFFYCHQCSLGNIE